ncbi:MAG TPA: hypothetical protein ENI20_10295 [Bacteroides sp.]|nr:hypothetical protein [Bacteroides sp.]
MKNKKKLSRIKLFEEIVSFMENNLDKWNSIEEIRRTYDEFTHNLKKLKDLQPELERDLAPVLSELGDKRELLMQRLFPVGNILEVYAEDHKMGKKSISLLKSSKKLDSLSNKKLLSHATRLYRLIDKYMHQVEGAHEKDGQINPGQDIKRYGLAGSMMDDLNTANHQYQSALHLRKDVFVYRKKVNKKMDGLLTANWKLLTSRLNKLMTVFSGTHPTFYREYKRISTQK